jgi:FixJ family two-component response regulator
MLMSIPPTVFVIDDDPAARESVCALAEAHHLAAEGFASAEEFLTRFDPARPGCAVIDLRLPEMNGLDLQATLQKLGAELPVIVISAFADVPSAVRAMRSGAVTLLEKPCRETELWDSIQAALEQDAAQRRNREQVEAIRLRLEKLSPGEREVLNRLVAGQMNKLIALELNISLRTVENRRQKLMGKMGVNSVAELVREVLKANVATI